MAQSRHNISGVSRAMPASEETGGDEVCKILMEVMPHFLFDDDAAPKRNSQAGHGASPPRHR